MLKMECVAPEDGTLVLRSDGTIESADPRAKKLLGYPEERLHGGIPDAGNDLREIATDHVFQSLRPVLSGELEEAYGVGMFRLSGGVQALVRWHLWAIPQCREERALLRFSLACAESGLGPSVFHDTTQFAVVGFYRASPDGAFLTVNSALARLYGYGSPEDLIHQVRDVDTQLYVDPIRRAEFKRLLETEGAVSGFETQVYTASGEVMWTAEYTHMVRDSDGRALFCEGTVIDISQRRETEEALRRSEEKFRHLVETANVVPWEADFRTGNFTYVGPQAARLLGCMTSDWLSPGFWEHHVHPDDRNWVPIFRQEGLERRQEFDCEYRLIRDDGKIVWIREIVSVLPSDDDSYLVGGFMFELTHRRHAEESLKDSQLFLEQLAAASPTILYLYDPGDPQCFYLSGRVQPILGYTKDALQEIQPFFLEALAHPEELAFHKEHVKHLQASHADEVLERQVRLRSSSGEWIWLQSRECVFKRDEKGFPSRVIGTLEDITSRKSAIEELEVNELLFRRLAETTNVIPFDYDCTAGIFTYIGPQAETMLGYPIKHWFTRGAWLHIVHPEDILEATRFAAEVYSLPSNHQTEFRLIAADQRVVWIRQIFHRESERDERVHVRGFLLDITESKRLETEREQSRTELRELSARSQFAREEERMNIAREIHDELGQALTMIKLDLAWVTSKVDTVPDRPELSPIRQKLEVMDQTIASTLQTVRRVLSALRPPLLDELGLAEAIEWYASEFSRRSALRCDVRVDQTPEIPIDTALALFRIFQEITTNVARHARATRVSVELRVVDEVVTLLVVDNGRGMSDAELNKKGHFGLLGMKERAWAVGGRIWVESSPGKGTSVRAEIPILGDTRPSDPRGLAPLQLQDSQSGSPDEGI